MFAFHNFILFYLYVVVFFSSSGFSFSKCHAEIKVPADPHLHQIFDGEEFSKYARFWTRGYDVYTPNKVIYFLFSFFFFAVISTEKGYTIINL